MTVTVPRRSVSKWSVNWAEESAQAPVSRASVRAASGDVTAAAPAGVNRRRAAEVVPLPQVSVAAAGQMTRMSVAVGAVMVMVTPFLA